MIAKNIASKFPPDRGRNYYIKGKIGTDPAYNAVFEALRGREGPLWDGGCGLGLLAFYLRERGWQGAIHGTDLSAEKIALGNDVAKAHYPGVTLSVGSITEPPHGFTGNVTLIDVLHYLDVTAQQALLARVRAMVTPGGVAVIRFTARDRSWRYYATYLEEMFVRGSGWIRGGRICFPTQDEVAGGFREAGWATTVRPLWGRTPFNSYLLLATPPER
ncbi:MAG: class I SAM-dependent methyltransferase [Rariglobus sp.]